jgi:hypothetical protein
MRAAAMLLWSKTIKINGPAGWCDEDFDNFCDTIDTIDFAGIIKNQLEQSAFNTRDLIIWEED